MTDSNNIYRNKPQFNTNPQLNKNITPDVPKFNSNAMDNDNFFELNSCHKNNSENKHNNEHEHCGCHCEDDGNKKCNCDHHK